MTAAPFGEVVEFWGCITAHWRLPLGSCLKLRSSLTYGLHLPSIDRPRNRAGKFYRALLRRLAQAVAGDPLAVRVVVRNPGHSRRARVPLSCGRRAPRHHGNSCDAHHKAGEHNGGWTHVHVPSSCGASITRRRARDRCRYPGDDRRRQTGERFSWSLRACRGRNFLGPYRSRDQPMDHRLPSLRFRSIARLRLLRLKAAKNPAPKPPRPRV
jgi:hypothetical protein